MLFVFCVMSNVFCYYHILELGVFFCDSFGGQLGTESMILMVEDGRRRGNVPNTTVLWFHDVS